MLDRLIESNVLGFKKKKLHPIATHVYTSNIHLLPRIRFIVCVLLCVFYFADLFARGYEAFFLGYCYYTIWGETLVLLYFFGITFIGSFSKTTNYWLLTLQHIALSIELVVVSMFWGVLAPSLGFGPWGIKLFLGIYKHSIPMLCNTLIKNLRHSS